MQFGPFKMPVEVPPGLVDELVALATREVENEYHCNSRAVQDAECARPLLEGCLDAVQAAAGVTLKPAWSYFRVYEQGSYIREHTDRPRLDWTVSIMLRCDRPPWRLEVQREDGAWQALEYDVTLVNTRRVLHRRPTPYLGSEACVLALHYEEQQKLAPIVRQEAFHPVVAPALLSGEEIAAIRALAPSLKFGPGVVGGDNSVPPESMRKSTTAWLGRKGHGWLFDRLQSLAAKLADDDLLPLASIQYGRYEPGGHYDWHQDAVDNSFSRYRRVSLSIPLQHAKAGGHLEIQGRDLPHQRPGDCVLFDSAARHRVSPVEVGLRESLVAWFERERNAIVVEDVLSPDEVRGLLAAFTPGEFHSSLHGNDAPPDGCDHQIRWMEQKDPQWTWIFERLDKLTRDFLPGARMEPGTPPPERGQAMIPSKLMLGEYNEGQGYFWHADCIRGLWNEAQIVSMTLPLEHCEEGGEFEFKDRGVIDIPIGDALVFDSDMQHRVRPVTRGRRRVLVFWMRAL